jgi:immune inhibitor A
LSLKKARRLPQRTTFEEFYWVWRSSRRGDNTVGLDDGAITPKASTERQLIDRPEKKLTGTVQTMVLLVDFPDRAHDEDHSPERLIPLLPARSASCQCQAESGA